MTERPHRYTIRSSDDRALAAALVRRRPGDLGRLGGDARAARVTHRRPRRLRARAAPARRGRRGAAERGLARPTSRWRASSPTWWPVSGRRRERRGRAADPRRAARPPPHGRAGAAAGGAARGRGACSGWSGVATRRGPWRLLDGLGLGTHARRCSAWWSAPGDRAGDRGRLDRLPALEAAAALEDRAHQAGRRRGDDLGPRRPARRAGRPGAGRSPTSRWRRRTPWSRPWPRWSTARCSCCSAVLTGNAVVVGLLYALIWETTVGRAGARCTRAQRAAVGALARGGHPRAGRRTARRRGRPGAAGRRGADGASPCSAPPGGPSGD